MSKRLIQLLAGLAVAVVLVVGGVIGFGLTKTSLFALAQPPPSAQQQAYPLPPELAFLSSMTPDQRFDHVLGARVTFQNPQGQQVVLNMIPGKIASVGTNAVAITPNGSTQTRTFNVTSSTYVFGRPQRGSLSTFRPGDRVVVVAIGNSNDAVAIVGPHGMMAMPMMD